MILSSTWSTAPDFVSLDGKYYESRSSSSLSDLLRRPRCCSSQSFGATQTEAAVRFFTYRYLSLSQPRFPTVSCHNVVERFVMWFPGRLYPVHVPEETISTASVWLPCLLMFMSPVADAWVSKCHFYRSWTESVHL
jgi:hypothetical protein